MRTLMSMGHQVVLRPALRERLLRTIQQRLPRKSFGFLISSEESGTPEDFVLFEGNIRNSEVWKPQFEAYGRYFVQHDDAGFVALPEECWRLQKAIWKRGMAEVGVFHSHLRHPANFSQIDYELHNQRFHNLWHLIISVRNPEFPQMRAFDVSAEGVHELTIASDDVQTVPKTPCRGADPKLRDQALRQAEQILKLDSGGRPRCKDARAIYVAVNALLSTDDEEAIDQFLVKGFLAGSQARYAEHVAPRVCSIEGGRFHMGTNPQQARHFCGETPCHPVELSPFGMSLVPVTNELFSLFDPSRATVPAGEKQMPVVNVTWFDAAVFAMWMGCRLPTEAEWEFACGSGSESEWCCEDEGSLPRYAWYSENSGGVLQPVATREPNTRGLFDLHGNAWEWCRDTYEQCYYSRSAMVDPANLDCPAADPAVSSADKVCRGGSVHGLAEMCRTRYRFHDPAEFWSADLGFRLASNQDFSRR
jgi:formylglycine-generating enzyme required for sulfatase activity/proteasome lid subunit RPN8/RPN11